jgi:hypothetical protein
LAGGPRTEGGEQHDKEGRKGTQHGLRESAWGLRQLQ